MAKSTTASKVARIAPPAPGPKDPREKAFNQAFGTRLRAYREGMGWSQKRFAGFFGISTDQYKKYEYGTRSFPLYLLPLLRDLSDRAYTEWLAGLNTPQAPTKTRPTPR